jgi:hypothetical protein
MSFRLTVPCLILASLLGGAGPFSAAHARVSVKACPNPEYKEPRAVSISPEKRLRPLMDLIAKGEGDYNAVNRGHAGDTPGGIQSLKGYTFENFTVGEVIKMQKWELFAVGRYQFIPSTLRFAVRHSSVDKLDMFTPEVQDRLMVALIFYKRPAVGAFLRNDHNLIGWALNELAKEWASIEYRNGRGFYDHIGGNRAHVKRSELASVLKQVKASWPGREVVQ